MPVENELLLGSEPDAVPRARHFVTRVLISAGIADSAETALDAELVVTELVTNALLHARPPVTVRVGLLDPGVRIEVSDPFRLSPVRPLANLEAMTGRGIALVEALSLRWGVDASVEGKVVWAELGESEDGPGDEQEFDVDALLAAWDDDLPDGELRFAIRLGDVPTSLLISAKTHVDNVVREFILAQSGAASGAGSLLPPDLSQLIGSVVYDFAEARQEIKRQALASATAGRARTELTLTLPASAADAGEAYLLALDQVDSYARAARLLTLESLPQHRAFRHWYVDSLVTQLRRAARGEPPGERESLEQRLLSEYAVVAAAHHAADRAARLQNVTAALAAATTVEQVALAVVSEGVTILGASAGAMLLPGEDDRVEIAAAVGYSPSLLVSIGGQSPAAQLPGSVALRTGEEVWVESPRQRAERFPILTALEPSAAASCAVPLIVAHRVRGVLRFSFDVPRLFDEDERRFVRTLAAQTAQALERCHLYAAESEARASAERLASWLARLQRVTSELTLAPDPDQVADIIVTHLADALGATQASVCLLADADTLRIIRVGNIKAEVEARWHTHPVSARMPTAEAVRTNAPVLVRGREEYLRRFPDTAADDVPEGDVVVLPLSIGPRCLGAFGLRFPDGRLPDEASELPFLITLAETCAQALARAEALGQARVANDKLTFLAEASSVLAVSLDPPTTLANLARLVVPRLADWCAVQVVEEGELRTLAVTHIDPAKVRWAWQLQERYPTTLDQPTGAPPVIRSGRGELYPEISDEMVVAGAKDEEHLRLSRELGLSSAICVPLTGHEGTFGAITMIQAESGRHYDATDLSLAEDLARRAAIAVENARAFQAEPGRLAAMTHVAEAAQHAILAPVPARVGPVHLAAAYLSAAKDALVGGDLYEVVPRPGAVRIIVGDVRGKGLEAVRLATVVLGHFRSAAVERQDLGDVARQIDLRLRPYLGCEDFVTALIAEISDDGRCEVVLCGHPPALLAQSGTLTELGESGSPPLGLGADPVMTSVALQPGARVLVYTDGVLEARSPDGTFVDLADVVAPIHQPGDGPVLDHILARLREFTGPRLSDDVALLLAEYRPGDAGGGTPDP